MLQVKPIGLVFIGILATLIIGPDEVSCDFYEDSQRLMSGLLSITNKEIRPVRNYNESLTIPLQMKLNQIIDLDFRSSVLTVSVTVELGWYHYLMRWEPNAYGGIKHIVMPADKVWLPDIKLYNHADEKSGFTGEHVKMYYTGLMEWTSTQIFRATCEVKPKINSEQNCFLKFGSWTYDGFALDIQHKSGKVKQNYTIVEEEKMRTEKKAIVYNVPGIPIDLDGYIPNPIWTLTKTEVKNSHKFYDCCDEPYIDLMFYLTLKRSSPLAGVSGIEAWIIVSLLPLLVFIIPVQSNFKITFSIINLVLLILLMVSSSNQSEAKFLLLRCCYFFTFCLDMLCIIAAILVVNVYSRNSPMEERWKSLLSRVEKFTILKNKSTNSDGEPGKKDNDVSNNLVQSYFKSETENDETKRKWETLSTFLNTMFLCLFVIICMIGIPSVLFL